MATNMNVSIRYSTFLPVLMAVMNRTTGDVLELGPGVFSTPFLHWVCKKTNRNLLTIENNEKWFNFCRKYYRSKLSDPIRHKFVFVKDWDEAGRYINKKWDVVLVDHSPSDRRIEEIRKLAHLANYIIIHDADPEQERKFHYSRIFPLFKYRYDFREVEPATTVLSNFIDINDFKVL